MREAEPPDLDKCSPAEAAGAFRFFCHFSKRLKAANAQKKKKKKEIKLVSLLWLLRETPAEKITFGSNYKKQKTEKGGWELQPLRGGDASSALALVLAWL